MEQGLRCLLYTSNEEEVPEKAFYYNEFRKGESYTYSDDCLFLNIWAPMDAEGLPVLFYIHGGGFKGCLLYTSEILSADGCAVSGASAYLQEAFVLPGSGRGGVYYHAAQGAAQ